MRRRALSIGAGALFVVAVPVFLVATNVAWVINAPLLYSFGFDRHDIAARTGIERAELLSTARQIRDYFNGSEEFLTVGVVRSTISFSLKASSALSATSNGGCLAPGPSLRPSFGRQRTPPVSSSCRASTKRAARPCS